MKIVFSLEDKEKESVGTIIIEGDWQNHHFRNHVFRFLARMEPPDVNSSVEQSKRRRKNEIWIKR